MMHGTAFRFSGRFFLTVAGVAALTTGMGVRLIVPRLVRAERRTPYLSVTRDPRGIDL